MIRRAAAAHLPHKLAGALAASFGIAVALGWLLDVPTITKTCAVELCTAASFILSGASVVFISRRSIGSGALAVMLSGWCLLVMSADLISCAVGMPLSWDLAHDPGVPSIGTMLAFMVHSLAVISAASGALTDSLKRAMFGTVTAISGVAIIGHFIHAPSLYYTVPGVSTGMAIHTAVGLLILGIAGIPTTAAPAALLQAGLK